MRQTNLIARTAGLALLAGTAGASLAADGPDLRISGFGTLAAVQVDKPGVEFLQPGQTSGAGESASAKSDSRLGVQLDLGLNETFAGTLQLLGKHSGRGDDQPRVEWAFGKARLGGGFTLRAGRMGAPFFAVSDFREVGYANTWLRTPTDVYGQVFLRTFDGADLLFDGQLGGVPVTAQLMAGSTTSTYERTPIHFKRQTGLNVTAELADGVTLRVGGIAGRLTADSDSMRQLVDTLAATPFASVGEQINCTDRKASFSGVGLSVDRGAWVGSAEYTRRRTACYVPDTTGWHLMAGYRVGSVTPYAIVSKITVDDANVVNTIPTGVDPMLDFLSGTVDGLVSSLATQQKSVALGLRWDAWRNLALKAQLERIEPQGGRGFFRQVGPLPQGAVQVLSLAVDFVF